MGQGDSKAPVHRSVSGRRFHDCLALALLSEICVLPLAAVAQPSANPTLPQWAQVRGKTPRRALVVGISDYDSPTLKLPNSQTDAATVASRLKTLGFRVDQPTEHQTRTAFLKALDNFTSTLREGDIALFYFSGHGAERNGTDYLIPADTTELHPGREGLEAVDAEFVMRELEARKVSVAIIILDACREDPFASLAASAGTPIEAKGLAPIQADASGLFIGFAAAPHEKAFGGLSTDPPHSPSIFTRFLADDISQTGKSIFWIWNKIGADVFRVTGHMQRPWQNSSMFPELKLNPAPGDDAEAEQAWEDMVSSASDLTLEGDLENYLEIFPDSPFAPAAVAKLEELRSAPRQVTSPADTTSASTLENAELSGSVITRSVAVTLEDSTRVTARTALVLRSQPSSDAPAVGSVSRGTELKPLTLPNSNGWVPVEVAQTGARGFIPSVTIKNTLSAQSAMELDYAPGAVALGTNDVSRLSSTIPSAKVDEVRADITQPGGVEPDRALTVSYLRALRLRVELVKAGLRPEQLRIQLSPDSALPVDKVHITAVPLSISGEKP